jgi:hypothetical protein
MEIFFNREEEGLKAIAKEMAIGIHKGEFTASCVVYTHGGYDDLFASAMEVIQKEIGPNSVALLKSVRLSVATVELFEKKYRHEVSWISKKIVKDAMKSDPTKYFRRCRFCNLLKPSVDFKACGGCRLVYYCSKDCQKQSWKLDHREICDVLRLSI